MLCDNRSIIFFPKLENVAASYRALSYLVIEVFSSLLFEMTEYAESIPTISIAQDPKEPKLLKFNSVGET